MRLGCEMRVVVEVVVPADDDLTYIRIAELGVSAGFTFKESR